ECRLVEDDLNPSRSVSRLDHEPPRQVRKGDCGRVAGDTVHPGQDLGTQALCHVLADRKFVRELSENEPAVEDLATEDSLVERARAQQSRIMTMGQAMCPDSKYQIAHDPGKAIAGDRFEHVGLADSVDPTRPSLAGTACCPARQPTK